jgi:hypothetical protein
MTNTVNTPSRQVELLFAGTAAQNRLTVGFRIILAIPQIIVLCFLFIAAFVVAVIGWFAALIMGQLPEWAHTFLSGIIRWSTRVGAYLFLLTDAYPPFSFDDVDYPMRPVLPERGALNRVAVLFRIILAIPAFFFYQIVQNGLTFPLLLVMWFVVLITGEMPQSLYPAYMSLLRYELRFNAWFSMITPEYAWGMLGDTVLVDTGYTPPPFVPPAGAAPPPPPAPAPAQPFAYPQAPGAQAPTPPPGTSPGSPPVWPPPRPAPTASPPGAMPPPSPWERTAASTEEARRPRTVLVLQGAARGWMIFAIVWGSIVLVGQVTRNFGHHHKHHNTATVQLVTAPADTSGFTHVIGQAPTNPRWDDS